jgi:methionine sulfoxide reductase heme-binding subunit
MRGTKFALQGWQIVSFSALTVATIVGAIWLFHGIDEQGMRMTIRATGRTSCILFLSAFIASSLHKLWSTPLSAWLVRNRRYLGISMAVSHTYHAIALFGLWIVTAGTAPSSNPLGTLGYILLIAMTVTSSNAQQLGWVNGVGRFCTVLECTFSGWVCCLNTALNCPIQYLSIHRLSSY